MRFGSNGWLVFGLMFIAMLVLGAGAFAASRIDDPLLRVLVRKGILTEEEALEIKREAELEAQKENEAIAKAAADKVKKEGLVLPKGLKGVKLGTLTYIDYSNGYGPFDSGKEEGQSYFAITRAYFNFKKKITPWLSFRFTPDLHGGNADDYDLRIKYAYAEFKLPNLGFFTDLKMEVGQGHFPWLDFEEHMNPYRMQGTMAREFFGTFNSADRGISLAGYLGGKLDKSYVNRLTVHYPVFDHYAGKYGSFWFSYMNGSGYHGRETNENKGFEGRITLRPFGTRTSGSFPLAGLQFSYFFIRAKGGDKADLNPFRKPEYPDYNVDLLMLSYQHPWFVIALQYSTSEGNSAGSWVVDTDGDGIGDEELETRCWSLFADVTLPIFNERLHLFGRYDRFDPNDGDDFYDGTRWVSDSNDEAEHYMVGLAYYLTGKNILMLNFEWLNYARNFRNSSDQFTKWGKYDPSGNDRLDDGFRVQTVLQISF
ncbi:hypothetical protein [Thermosulfurimonas dismutans]|uniref:Phosphate-selective porin O and P n=1 Tax=Thermosulfurimonas dismutans TaxID=999894 RepID=A0A179D337_9BACT|nr:hypothetical protein [Thermosulfurimonas dismutans]OAQ20211.1 hypothetical protein TDIS_1713 [Thermosulfurimonas dismutans]